MALDVPLRCPRLGLAGRGKGRSRGAPATRRPRERRLSPGCRQPDGRPPTNPRPLPHVLDASLQGSDGLLDPLTVLSGLVTAVAAFMSPPRSHEDPRPLERSWGGDWSRGRSPHKWGQCPKGGPADTRPSTVETWRGGRPRTRGLTGHMGGLVPASQSPDAWQYFLLLSPRLRGSAGGWKGQPGWVSHLWPRAPVGLSLCFVGQISQQP